MGVSVYEPTRSAAAVPPEAAKVTEPIDSPATNPLVENATEPAPKVRFVPTNLETLLAVIANAFAVTEPVAVPFAKL